MTQNFSQNIFESRMPVSSTQLVSVIVPTHNDAPYIADTIETILDQQNCRLELIFIDAESTDRTVEIIRTYEDSRIRIQLVPTSNIFEMLNRGIAMAQGDYISILMPGDTYLYPSAVTLAMEQVEQNDFPDLFYTACYLSDEFFRSHLFFRPFSKEYLRKGMQPSCLQSCFIKKSAFKKVGYFDTRLTFRGDFDFFIRCLDTENFSIASELRVYVEFSGICLRSPFLLRHFTETFQILHQHYGLTCAVIWFFKQSDLKRFFVNVYRRCKEALFGKKVSSFS
jgi:glycosyltransferase involved in cell wall biosynthesis